MSQVSIIILSESAQAELLSAALERTRDGERLLVVPPHLHPYLGSEPALNIAHPSVALRDQLIDRAIAALRPDAIIADLESLQSITPNLDRYPQLKRAVLMSDGTEKKRHLREQAAMFEHASIVGR
ncbi:MAG: hypothetical protein ACI8XO_000210 [Verrucomicrobiales bacterium]|jgi:hypothetical protein